MRIDTDALGGASVTSNAFVLIFIVSTDVGSDLYSSLSGAQSAVREVSGITISCPDVVVTFTDAASQT